MEKKAGWRSKTAIVVGGAMALPSTVVIWFTGHDASVPVVVGGVLVAGGLLSGVLPDQWLERWLDRVKTVEAKGAGMSAKVELAGVSDAESGMAIIKAELASGGDANPILLEQVERVSKSLDRVANATVEQIIPRFKTRYLTSETNPYSRRGPEAGKWIIWVTGAGNWKSDTVAYYELIGRIDGPEGFTDTMGIPQDMNPPDHWFQWTHFFEDAPEGDYIARWYLRDAAGDEVHIRSDEFRVPTSQAFTNELSQHRI